MSEDFHRQVLTLTKIIDDLDYYQILKLDQDAFAIDIKDAYYRESRLFHPDKFYNEPKEFQEKVTKIFKRINEAYKVLKEEESRAMYTSNINGPDRPRFLRFNPKLIEEEKKKEEDEGQTPMGKRYYQMAKTAYNNKDYKGARINLQLAAKVEPDNQTFKDKLEEVEALLKIKKKHGA